MANAGPFAVIAHVNKTHGLKGEVSVAPATEAPLASLVGLSVWFVPPSTISRTARIAAVRPGPKGLLVSFDGITTIQDATHFVSRDMLASVAELPSDWECAFDDEVDEIDLTVTDVVHGLLGEVVETIVTGANDVWVVDGPFGEILIPVIDDVVLEVDHESNSALVRLLPGLLPDESEEA